jgi:hypothetical protein
MSVTVLSVQTVSRAGVDLTAQAVAPDSVAGCKWLNSGAETLVVNNGSGGSLTVTLHYGPGAVFDGSTVSNKTVSVPSGDIMEIGPFPQGIFNDVNGYATATFSTVTSVTVVARKTGS